MNSRLFMVSSRFASGRRLMRDPSKVRFVRARHVGLFSRVPSAVFGAHIFGPVQGAVSIPSICHRRGPLSGEDVLVLDRELELQILAGSVRKRRPRGIVMLL